MKNLIKYINEWKYDKNSKVRKTAIIDHIKIECYDKLYNGEYNKEMNHCITETISQWDQETIDYINEIICTVKTFGSYDNKNHYDVNIKINNVDYFIQYVKSDVEHSTTLNFEKSNIENIGKYNDVLFVNSKLDLFSYPIVMILNTTYKNEIEKAKKSMEKAMANRRNK